MGIPSLTVLQVYYNGISSISSFPSSIFPSLKELDLDANLLSSWDDVEQLSEIPCLEYLRLNGNKLSDISTSATSFPKLKSLQITDNQISSWSSIGRLDKLTALRELRFRGNPLNKMERDDDTVRQLIVARISRLTCLNGSVISPTERRWSEIDYLKSYGLKYLALANLPEDEQVSGREQFLLDHNRYDEMVAMFGEPDPKDGVAEDTSLKSSLIKVIVRTPQVHGSADSVKKIPLSMTVSKLRA